MQHPKGLRIVGGNLDGLKDAQGQYLVTDFMAGALYRISTDGTYETLLKLKQSNSDLELLNDKKTVVIPKMMEDAVSAYKGERGKLAA